MTDHRPKKAWLIKTPQAVLKEDKPFFFFFPPHSHFSKWQERKLFGQTTKLIHRISQADTSWGPYMMPTEVSRSPGYHPSMGGWGCWEVGSTAQGAGRGLARGLVQPPHCCHARHRVAPLYPTIPGKSCVSHTPFPRLHSKHSGELRRPRKQQKKLKGLF